MSVIENSENIKQRLQQEAARQWGYGNSEIDTSTFDPMVDILMGAFAVESEKIWHEIEVSRSRTLDRLIEVLLPEVWSNALPAHSVMMAQPADNESIISSITQFSVPVSEPVYFSPAGDFKLIDAKVQVIATGRRIDAISFQQEALSFQYKRESIELQNDKFLPSDVCWIGIEISEENIHWDSLTLFFNWANAAERTKYLPYLPDILFYPENKRAYSDEDLQGTFQANNGITTYKSTISDESKNIKATLDSMMIFEKQVREFYGSHFMTLTNLSESISENQLKKYPNELEILLDCNQKEKFQKNLLWIKLKCPAALAGDAITKMEVSLNCFPVLNRKLNHQQGKLQPIFNVFGLTEETGFLGVQRVLNGDGVELMPVEQKELDNRQNVYALRKRGVARFDQRDAFESFGDLIVKMRDDMAAFEALDNTILSNYLSNMNKTILKVKEHLSSFSVNLPSIYLLARTKSLGKVIDLYYWTTIASKANDIERLKKLLPEKTKDFKNEPILLMLPSTGGRERINEDQKKKAFREALLTRGRAVTTEDFKTITYNILGTAALNVEVKKQLNIGEAPKQGLKRILAVIITPNPSEKHNEEYWLQRCQLIKVTLEERSTGVLPLVVSVVGYKWKL